MQGKISMSTLIKIPQYKPRGIHRPRKCSETKFILAMSLELSFIDVEDDDWQYNANDHSNGQSRVMCSKIG